MNKVGIFVLLMFNSVCFADDFLLREKSEQIFEAGGVKEVIISCYCGHDVDIKENTTDEIKLSFEAEYGSGGYHGYQEVPEKIPEKLIKFANKKTGATLNLESKEFTYIHHAYLIKNMDVYIPKHVKCKIKSLNIDELEGRNE